MVSEAAKTVVIDGAIVIEGAEADIDAAEDVDIDGATGVVVEGALGLKATVEIDGAVVVEGAAVADVALGWEVS